MFTSVVAGGLLGTSLGAGAQSPGKVVRIGWLGTNKRDHPIAAPLYNVFFMELQRLGWTEGRDFVFEHRYSEGIVDRFPRLARELVDLNPDVIYVSNGVAALALKEATRTIPIVFVGVNDPVGRGIVASLGRPGGNLTGLSTLTFELIGKRLELLKETSPGISRVAFLPVTALAPTVNEEAYRAAKTLGLQLLPAQVKGAEDLPAAIAALAHADAWFVGDDPLYFAHAKTITSLLAAQRKPAMYPHTLYVEAGGLMSYSTDLKDQTRRAAGYVDRILRGAKPADLPVEQPTRFELAINLQTARAIGVTLPKVVMFRADKVIE